MSRRLMRSASTTQYELRKQCLCCVYKGVKLQVRAYFGFWWGCMTDASDSDGFPEVAGVGSVSDPDGDSVFETDDVSFGVLVAERYLFLKERYHDLLALGDG